MPEGNGSVAATTATDKATSLGALYKHLRVTDVADAMDGMGYFNIGLMSQEVRPLWLGMKFWGEAMTIRCVPSNRPMWKLDTTDEIVAAHGIWFKEVGNIGTKGLIESGNVVVMDSGGGPEVGFWGSENALGALADGAVGIITDGYCRDTAELALQKTPICSKARGRTIIPGRIQVAEVQGTIACGGVQVRPGDMVGCDDDGIIVVPKEIAEQVAVHARAVLLADMHKRRDRYDVLEMAPDGTVDFDAVEAYYAEL
jgi:regulator of RNase E activity RraA